MALKILIIDDEATILQLTEKTLEKEGYSVSTSETGKNLLERVRSFKPDLVIMDVMLRDANGVDLTMDLRKNPDTRCIPVILISGQKTDADDQIFGLAEGADDYLIKPLVPKLLAAKVQTVLRRFKTPKELGEVLKHYNLSVDVSERFVKGAGKDVKLTKKEFDLLAVFLRKQGKLLTPQFLLETVWNYEPETYNDPHTVQVHISRLKKKLGKSFADRLENVIGSGYRLN